MKSIKLASGFAVSALALAIAGQATAQEATTEVDFTGSVKVNTVLDLEQEGAYYNGAPGYATADEDWFNLTATWSVTHGPFSGDIRVGIHEKDSSGIAMIGNTDDNNGTVFVDNLRVDQGPFAFGQIGSVADTADILEELTDFEALATLDYDEQTVDYDVDAAFRYTVADLGLRIQAEGAVPGALQNETDDITAALLAGDDTYAGFEGRSFGVGAAIHQDLDVAEVWADVQMRQFVEHVLVLDGGNLDAEETLNTYDGMGDAEFAWGFGAKSTPVDMVELTAVVRGETLSEQVAFAVRGDVQATEEVSVYGVFAEANTDDDADSAAFKAGTVINFAPITLEASYESRTEELGEGLVLTKLSYTEAAITGYGEFNYALDGFGGSENGDYEFVVGAEYAFDSGVVFGSEYTNTGSDWYDGGDVSEFEAFAQYSF